MRQPWLILADDLTGAADCGIAFARRGRSVLAGWPGAVPQGPADVLAIDADSRRLPPAAAGDRHAALLRAHHAPGRPLLKKLDSTLRGQPVAEIAALRATGAPRLAILAPAFPAVGRTTREGRVLLQGAPLEHSPLWAREHSYPHAHLPGLLDAAGLPSRLLPLPLIRAGEAAIAAALRAALAEGLAAVVCDALDAADLTMLARASLPLADDVFWAGSGGIAAALAEALPATDAPPAPVLPPATTGRLLVVGSVAEASRAAAARLLAADDVAAYPLPSALLRAGPADPAWTSLSATLEAAITAGQDTLVLIAEDPQADLRDGAPLAAALAELLLPAARRLSGLFATGGETACALLTRLGIPGLRLLEEVEPGLPLGIALGARPFPVITKAGAFGDDGTLLRGLARLRALSPGAAR